MQVPENGPDDAWFNQYAGYQDFLIFDGTGDSPTKPGKAYNSDPRYATAYYLYQLQKDEKQTKAAEEAYESFRRDYTYWAQRDDLNLSHEQIMDKLDIDNNSKYAPLVKMEEAAKLGAPVSLNRAVPWNRDDAVGFYYAARNNGGTGNIIGDCMSYYKDAGNTWSPNKDIEKRLDPTSDSYNPFVVGATADSVCSYFGVKTVDQALLTENAWMKNSPVKEERDAYKQAEKVYATTEAANAEVEWLNKRVEAKIASMGNNPDEEKILEAILGTTNTPTLNKIDAYLSGDGTAMPQFGSAVQYDAEAIRARIH